MNRPLVIGIGNVMRRDDPAGIVAVEEIARRHPHVVCLCVQVLRPELAEQEVKGNEVLCILGAMKMKTNGSSPHAGKITAIFVNVGDTIEPGKPLLTFC